MTEQISKQIISLAEKYENEKFLASDPSCFMHKVEGRDNQETTAFVASCLSYGSRKQFFPKIQYILDCSGNDVFSWVAERRFENDIPDNEKCYYRLYTCHDMNKTLGTLADMIDEHGSIRNYVIREASDGFSAIEAICRYFSSKGTNAAIPKNANSACKRICMFLRWMVRDNSPVDLGLWNSFIDKRTLIMPLDTHVVQEACRLGLLSSKSASMGAAKRLTKSMLEIFPDDPLKGDFALFGLGVDEERPKKK